MTENVHVLQLWILGCLVIAAICTTAFPVLYAFSPWRSSPVGKLLMLQSVAFALAIDLTALFQVWVPGNIMVIFWINAFVFGLIAFSTAALTSKMWRMNFRSRPSKWKSEHQHSKT